MPNKGSLQIDLPGTSLMRMIFHVNRNQNPRGEVEGEREGSKGKATKLRGGGFMRNA